MYIVANQLYLCLGSMSFIQNVIYEEAVKFLILNQQVAKHSLKYFTS